MIIYIKWTWNKRRYIAYAQGVLIVKCHSCFDLSYGYQLFVITPKRALIIYT